MKNIHLLATIATVAAAIYSIGIYFIYRFKLVSGQDAYTHRKIPGIPGDMPT